MKTSTKIIQAIIHIAIFVITVLLTIKGVLFGADPGQVGNNMIYWGYFKAFTIDSNDLAAISSLIMAVYLIRSIVKKDSKVPYWAVLLQYMSGVAVGLTFITTLTFLAPTQVSLGNSYWLFFSGDMFFLHFLTPFSVIAMFIWGNKDLRFSKKDNILGLIPLTLYAIVYITTVVFLKTWQDFYGFTFGGKMWCIAPSLLVVYGVSYLIGLLMIKANNFRRN